MEWNKITQKCREVYQIDAVTPGNPTKRKLIIRAIADEFPQLPHVRIAATVDRCIQQNSDPMTTKDFISCLQSNFR